MTDERTTIHEDIASRIFNGIRKIIISRVGELERLREQPSDSDPHGPRASVDLLEILARIEEVHELGDRILTLGFEQHGQSLVLTSQLAALNSKATRFREGST